MADLASWLCSLAMLLPMAAPEPNSASSKNFRNTASLSIAGDESPLMIELCLDQHPGASPISCNFVV